MKRTKDREKEIKKKEIKECWKDDMEGGGWVLKETKDGKDKKDTA